MRQAEGVMEWGSLKAVSAGSSLGELGQETAGWNSSAASSWGQVQVRYRAFQGEVLFPSKRWSNSPKDTGQGLEEANDQN